jgi:hypothetical protein
MKESYSFRKDLKHIHVHILIKYKEPREKFILAYTFRPEKVRSSGMIWEAQAFEAGQ